MSSVPTVNVLHYTMLSGLQLLHALAQKPLEQRGSYLQSIADMHQMQVKHLDRVVGIAVKHLKQRLVAVQGFRAQANLNVVLVQEILERIESSADTSALSFVPDDIGYSAYPDHWPLRLSEPDLIIVPVPRFHINSL